MFEVENQTNNDTKPANDSEWALASDVKAVENVQRIPANNSNIPNLYDATPDHSILKNGLAKSLSQVIYLVVHLLLDQEMDDVNLLRTVLLYLF